MIRSSSVILACLAACETYDTVPAAHAPSLASGILDAERQMHARYSAAMAMEQAIAHGDLETARAEARTLDFEEPEILAQYQPFLQVVRADAHRVVVSAGLDSASVSAANVGRACARCHEATGAHVTFPVVQPPRGNDTLASDMSGHQWAALQMWQGLIGPADELWQTGASGLTKMPANILAQLTTRAPDDDIDDVARIKLYANRAVDAHAQDARAELFGRILATCAHCHSALRDR